MNTAKLSDDAFRRIGKLMHESIGLSLTENKMALVASRLAARLQRLGLDSFSDYAALLASENDRGEFQVAVDLLTTNETYFFREPDHFSLIERELRSARPHELSVWSAASSFGDEAYSTAMLLADLQVQGTISGEWQVLGTDISDRVLCSAVQAIYPLERLRHVSPERLRRYCLRGEGESEGMVRIKPALVSRVRFGQVNLCRPVEALGPFDIVFLRNVLIYFDPPTKVEVVDRVLSQLRPGGLFFLGTAEGRVACQTPLQALAPGAFRKIDR